MLHLSTDPKTRLLRKLENKFCLGIPCDAQLYYLQLPTSPYILPAWNLIIYIVYYIRCVYFISHFIVSCFTNFKYLVL